MPKLEQDHDFSENPVEPILIPFINNQFGLPQKSKVSLATNTESPMSEES